MSLLSPRLCGPAPSVASFLLDKIHSICHLHEHAFKVNSHRAYKKSVIAFLERLSQQDLHLECVADLDDALALYITLLLDDNPRRGERQ